MVSGERPELDVLPPEDVVELLLQAEERVVPAVRRAAADIVAAARVLAATVTDGGRLVFAGAGTSGRLAVLQAAELPGTFGLDRDRVVGLLAGAAASLAGADADEDDAAGARAGVDALRLRPGDVLVAVAVSGSTPYTLAAAEAARASGAQIVAVVGQPGSRLAGIADVAVETDVGAEVLHGSTRLSAGTAHKVALDAMTTAAMALAGRVHGHHMIDVVPANAKLQDRLVDIVADIAGGDAAAARTALHRCDWDARVAVVSLRLDVTPDEARKRVAAAASLRAALD